MSGQLYTRPPLPTHNDYSDYSTLWTERMDPRLNMWRREKHLNILPLPGSEPKFLGYPACILNHYTG